MQKNYHIFKKLFTEGKERTYDILRYTYRRGEKIMKLLIITADRRQIFMAEKLMKKGIECYLFTPEIFKSDRKEYYDGVVFALPCMKSSEVNCEYPVTLNEIFSLVKKGGYIFSAMSDDLFNAEIKRWSLENFDYYEREELIILNAGLTAEGVLEIVLSASDVSMNNLNILVTGYGRTGQAISEILSRNLVSVTVAARKETDRVKGKMKKMKTISFDEIEKHAEIYDFVINTVPTLVIDKNLLEKFRNNCVFVEVASRPYGIDISYAKSHNKKLIIASSLPGKYVPRSAGFFIADTIINIIKEEGINE